MDDATRQQVPAAEKQAQAGSLAVGSGTGRDALPRRELGKHMETDPGTRYVSATHSIRDNLAGTFDAAHLRTALTAIRAQLNRPPGGPSVGIPDGIEFDDGFWDTRAMLEPISILLSSGRAIATGDDSALLDARAIAALPDGAAVQIVTQEEQMKDGSWITAEKRAPTSAK
jgi:hypothetical protein